MRGENEFRRHDLHNGRSPAKNTGSLLHAKGVICSGETGINTEFTPERWISRMWGFPASGLGTAWRGRVPDSFMGR